MGLLVDVLFCTTKGQRSGVWGFGVEAVVDVDRLDICHGSTVSMLACRLVQGAMDCRTLFCAAVCVLCHVSAVEGVSGLISFRIHIPKEFRNG